MVDPKRQDGPHAHTIILSPDERFAFVADLGLDRIFSYRFDAAKRGALLELQTLSTLPATYKGGNDCAEVQVHPNGKFRYGSNRGHDSIATFAIGPKDTLTFLEAVPTGGKTPRNFALDPSGAFLFAANQGSNQVTIFRVEAGSGRLTPTGEGFNVPSPVCVRFLAVK